MTCWSYLPTDILHIVFEYLNGEKATLKSADHLSFPIKGIFAFVPRRDILQCQMTCKNWAGLAQLVFYKNIGLYYSSKRAESFIDALKNYKLGYLIETIIIVFRQHVFQEQILLSLIPQIGYWCPNLKCLYTNYEFNLKHWKCIQIERLKGSFSKLQEVTSPITSLKKHEVIQYNEAAYSLRESLRALTIYQEKSVQIKNLEHFTNIHALYFKFDIFNDVYTLDQQIKGCPSIKSIDIQYTGDNEHLIRNTDTSSSIHICPQVKQLLATKILFDSRLCGYLMKVFPNITEIDLEFNFSITQPTAEKVSNNTALQFLSYLMKMSSAYICYFPVDDMEDLLTNFHDINGMNRHLKIHYDRNHDGFSNYLPSLLISIKERKIDIHVGTTKDERINLPRIGMIEKSGRKLQSLSLHMGMNIKFMQDQEFGLGYNGTDFYHILLYCPNLKNIHITNTLLPCLGIDVQQKQRLLLYNFILECCFIGSGFFPELSFHVPYIHTLIIQDTNVIVGGKQALTTKYIEMPLTELDSICYIEKYIIHRIFLKLEKTGEGSVRWFVSNQKNRFEPCAEEAYEKSLNDHFSMTFSICCVNVRIIEINIIEYKIIFKT